MKLRVGLVGLGQAWESRYRPALRALSDRFEVRAVFDQVALRAEQVAREFQSEAVGGFRVLAGRPDIDAVLMLAPQWYGCLPILAACDAEKAVYCAFGMELDLAQARLVHDRVQQAGVAFMAEFPRRQSPATLRLKELIATSLGPPKLLFCHIRVPAEITSAKGGKSITPSSPTGALTELVDWCTYVVGRPPASVMGIAHRVAGESDDDYQMMSLDFSAADVPHGAVAQISCGRYMQSDWHEALTFRPPAALQVCCVHGVAFLDLPSSLVWFDSAGRHQESLDTDRPAGEQLLCQFHRAVTSLVRDTSSLEDSYRALEVVLRARESCVTGKRAFLDVTKAESAQEDESAKKRGRKK